MKTLSVYGQEFRVERDEDGGLHALNVLGVRVASGSSRAALREILRESLPKAGVWLRDREVKAAQPTDTALGFIGQSATVGVTYSDGTESQIVGTVLRVERTGRTVMADGKGWPAVRFLVKPDDRDAVWTAEFPDRDASEAKVV